LEVLEVAALEFPGEAELDATMRAAMSCKMMLLR